MSLKAIEIKGLEKIFHLGLLSPIPYLKELKIPSLVRKVHALKGIDLSVEQGEIFGFLGHNGAGKSTTMKILTGLISPTQGEARIFGHDVGSSESKSKIGFLPEVPQFYEDLNAVELLDFAGALCGLDPKTRYQRSMTLLEQVSMTEAMYRPLRKLSKGMLQRIAVIQAFINEPSLIILDEPMSGLDPIGRKEIRELILAYRQKGSTIFLSSHILPDIEMICDRFAILDRGEIKTINSIDAVWDGQSQMEIWFSLNQAITQAQYLQWEATIRNQNQLSWITFESLHQRKKIQATLEGETLITHVKICVFNQELNQLLSFLLNQKNQFPEFTILGIHSIKHNLEDIFIQYTHNGGKK